jgi:hypothetical protein
MIIALLIAGIAFLLAGLLGVAYGIPIKEFSFGNTVIIAGALTACTGMIMIALFVVVRELRAIAEHFEASSALGPRAGFPAPLSAAGAAPHNQAPGDQGSLFDQSGAANPASGDPGTPPPWHEETATRDRGRGEAPPEPAVETAPVAKPRRNLLFSSTSRKERERAEGRAPEVAVTESLTPPAVVPPVKPSEPPPATFEDAWPQSERPRSVDVRRSTRTPSTPAESNPPAVQPPRREEPQAVTVLKSGVVDGMAYSLYSDGSIEAQMPEGMMRFASIDELRAHLDQRS